MTTVQDRDRVLLSELEPVLRRAAGLDPNAICRLRLGATTATVLARLPFGVLVSRTIDTRRDGDALDVTVRADQSVAWLAGERADPPENRDADWRGGIPPGTGWHRLDTIPDDVVRGLVRKGALALKDAATREGVPGAQPRAEVADALLDSVVLTVEGEADGQLVPGRLAAGDRNPAPRVPARGDGNPAPRMPARPDGDPALRAEVTLRTLSALTRMGFLPRGGSAAVDIAGRWTRVAGGYGSVYAERPGAGLMLR